MFITGFSASSDHHTGELQDLVKEKEEKSTSDSADTDLRSELSPNDAGGNGVVAKAKEALSFEDIKLAETLDDSIRTTKENLNNVKEEAESFVSHVDGSKYDKNRRVRILAIECSTIVI